MSDLVFSSDNLCLTITANEEERDELRETMSTDNSYRTDEHVFIDFIEQYRCNGYLELVDPEQVGALTDSLLLTDYAVYSDFGDELVGVGKVYWYRDYQVRGYVDTLIEDGQITFHADGE